MVSYVAFRILSTIISKKESDFMPRQPAKCILFYCE